MEEELKKTQEQCVFLQQLLWLSLHNRGPLRAPLLELRNWQESRMLSIQNTTEGKIECKALHKNQIPTST